jgi:acyl-[acyl carrier protein]--UDP-N-acetylglucosamine O-acyltransferase
MNKYELLKDDTLVFKSSNCEVTLFRVRYLIDIPTRNVFINQLGGYIERESNLSHSGDCCVCENARVYGNANVSGNARVGGYASVFGDSRIYGNACVFGNVRIFENAHLWADTIIRGDCNIYGNAQVCGSTCISGEAKIHGTVRISGNTHVGGSTQVSTGILRGNEDFMTLYCNSHSFTAVKNGVQIGCKFIPYDECLLLDTIDNLIKGANMMSVYKSFIGLVQGYFKKR